MTRRYLAPMPPQLRHQMRAKHHPARTVPCSHCGAKEHQPCKLRKSGRILTDPHPQRVTAWARQTARCPECQAEPTVPCHDDGHPPHGVHARRYQEAEEVSA